MAVVLAMQSCRADPDLVASSYGDLDPGHPPDVLALTGSLHLSDPYAIRVGQRIWIFSTGPGIPTRSSADMLQWQDEGQVFAQNPSWIAPLLPAVTDLWSPALAYFGGKFHLYYAASTFSSNQSCIGHATADTIGQGSPFLDQGQVICSNVSGAVEDFNAIDPSVYVETDGSVWLAFGSWESGIKLIALGADGGPVASPLFPIAMRPPSNAAIQACHLMKWRDFYYLFVSFDGCCSGVDSTHSIHVGRSSSLTGPYLDRDNLDMMDGGGTLVLESNADWKGPGSNMIFTDAGKQYNVYHAFDVSANGAATLRISELAFDNDGWPVSGGP